MCEERIDILDIHFTFIVDNITYHIVKIKRMDKIVYGLIKLGQDEVWLDKSHYVGDISVNDNLGILLNSFVDITTPAIIYCETTGAKILVSDNFIHFSNGLKSKENSYLFNSGCKACPEWEEIEIPKTYLGKVQTSNGITYILNLKDNVHLVT